MKETVTLENSHGLAMDYIDPQGESAEAKMHRLKIALTSAKQYIEQEDTFFFGDAERHLRGRLLLQMTDALERSK